MDFDLNKNEKLLKDSAREFLQKEFSRDMVREMEEDPRDYSPDIWAKMAELGYMALLIPEEYDGMEGSFTEFMVLMEEMGRACFPGPFFSTTLCTLAICAAGDQAQKKEILPRVASGELLLALALTEPSATYEAEGIQTQAVAEKDGYVLNGTKLFVHDAHIADYLICVARTGAASSLGEGISLFLVDAKSKGIKITPLQSIANDKQNELIFENVKVPLKNLLGPIDQGWPVVSRLIEQAALAKCAEMIGGSGWVLEAAVTHAKQRMQFDHHIGSYQSIQHYLVDMWLDLSLGRSYAYYAGWLVNQNQPCTKEIAAAKTWVSDMYRKGTRMGIRIKGALGTSWDDDMGLYYRRARQSALLFGSPDFHREVVATELGLNEKAAPVLSPA
ncbi:MAG: acyl-CoA/acyl-ACP dehydrogenase [Dehalococcoidia bacterium]|nr:acyl-CoA/acyl-ACP dehydrogenase [Dehalococcoidia bacterium]